MHNDKYLAFNVTKSRRDGVVGACTGYIEPKVTWHAFSSSEFTETVDMCHRCVHIE